MPVIRFEAADGEEYTAIGEGLTRPAREAGRLRTDVEGTKYAIDHADGCAVCGASVGAGEAFYLDSEAGEVLCEGDGRERRVERSRDGQPM
ncbi:hypothetical protein [Halomarina litorea]|uniref:hypothetical protein n=1 Tax=Halomarina litorea TaxID=2961595 RepID=UPI0020C4CC9A|nr:hypothetical protein [Halomarina sp. BCD28]